MAVCQMQNSAGTAVTSYMASVKFVKHLVKVALVNIVYHRLNVDPQAFEERSVKEYKYMACKNNAEDPIACSVYYAAKGVAHAIENKYLREVYLILKRKDSDEVSEYYKFTLTYKENSDSIALPKSEDVIKASIEFMNNIETLGNYKKLSSDFDIVVEILLSALTPKDYSPPHFRSDVNYIPRMNLLPEFVSPRIRVGYVNTGYHKLKCRATGNCFNETPVSTPRHIQSSQVLCFDVEGEKTENEIPGEEKNLSGDQLDNSNENEIQDSEGENNLSNDNNAVDEIQADGDDANQGKENNLLNDRNQQENCETKKSALKRSIYTISDISEVIADINAEDFYDVPSTKYRCPCTIKEDIKGTENILCSVCLHQQHTVCAGFKKPILVPDPYVCIYCKREDRPATDKILLGVKPQCWQDIAALRFALKNCKNARDSGQEVRDALSYLPKEIQYRAWEMLKKAKVVERDTAENFRSVKFNSHLVEAVSLRVFNGVAVPDSLQLCDEDDEENSSPKKKRKTVVSPKEKTKRTADASAIDKQRNTRKLRL